MTDESTLGSKPKLNKAKVYASAIGIFLLVDFGVETGITFLENFTHQWLYPIFPFTRIGLLIITIVVTSSYIRRKEHRPKQRLWWRVLRPALLILIAYGLTMGAWLSVSQADTDRAADAAHKARQSLQHLPLPAKAELNSTYEAN